MVHASRNLPDFHHKLPHPAAIRGTFGAAGANRGTLHHLRPAPRTILRLFKFNYTGRLLIEKYYMLSGGQNDNYQEKDRAGARLLEHSFTPKNFIMLFYHTNVRTPRLMGYVFQRPEMHRIHH